MFFKLKFHVKFYYRYSTIIASGQSFELQNNNLFRISVLATTKKFFFWVVYEFFLWILWTLSQSGFIRDVVQILIHKKIRRLLFPEKKFLHMRSVIFCAVENLQKRYQFESKWNLKSVNCLWPLKRYFEAPHMRTKWGHENQMKTWVPNESMKTIFVGVGLECVGGLDYFYFILFYFTNWIP